MSDRPPKFDDSALAAVLQPARARASFDREGRVKLIGEVAQALLARGDEASLFVGGAMLAWLENGGDLARDFLRVTKPKSHHTPAAIWRELTAHPDERVGAEVG